MTRRPGNPRERLGKNPTILARPALTIAKRPILGDRPSRTDGARPASPRRSVMTEHLIRLRGGWDVRGDAEDAPGRPAGSTCPLAWPDDPTPGSRPPGAAVPDARRSTRAGVALAPARRGRRARRRRGSTAGSSPRRSATGGADFASRSAERPAAAEPARPRGRAGDGPARREPLGGDRPGDPRRGDPTGRGGALGGTRAVGLE